MSYTYAIVKNVKMNWVTESHSFTFVTGGDYISSLDSLGDFIGSLKDLYCYILDNYDHGDALPYELKIRGNLSDTFVIDGKTPILLKHGEM
jgi:hypothetical protein